MKFITLITAVGAAVVLAVGAASAPSAAGGGSACTADELVRRQQALDRFEQTLPARRRAYFRTHRSSRRRSAFERRQKRERARLRKAVSTCRVESEPQLTEPRPFPFYPQAGILWRDLYIYNFVDLDDGPGTLDWSCGHQTYDGHTGEDSVIRGFPEKRIGVPVFAALDGRVAQVQDGGPDEHTAQSATPFDNHVILDNGGGQETVYGHLTRGIPVRVGQFVKAGTQIGLTASSGNSSGPHLHFTALFKGSFYEPFAGPCRAGPSYWVDQAAYPTDPYVQDVTLSASPFTDRLDLPWDEASRAGTFVLGTAAFYVRLVLANAAGAGIHVAIVRPDSSVAAEGDAPAVATRWGWTSRREEVALNIVGEWRLVVSVGGRTLAEAPFQVVGSAGDVVNHSPAGVRASLAPAAPHADDVVFCRVETSLVTEDPDYDLVRYRYRWTVDGTQVRAVTSAALSDAVPRSTARPGKRLTCEVTPSDGRLDGPTATATATVAG